MTAIRTIMFFISLMSLTWVLSSCGLDDQPPIEAPSTTIQTIKPQKSREQISLKPIEKPTEEMLKNRSLVEAQLDQICQEITPIDVKELPPLNSLTELEQRFIESHNDIRRRYRLSDLVWDKDLAIYAQQWAQYLKDHNRCQMEHRSTLNRRDGKLYGENLAIKWREKIMVKTFSDGREERISVPFKKGEFISSPEFAVIGWSQECQDYDYKNNSCPKNKMCGHFTQVVWADSKKVGCGMVTCDGKENSQGRGRAELWVCSYDPPGNYVGQKPF